jgi:hypothetical protein
MWQLTTDFPRIVTVPLSMVLILAVGAGSVLTLQWVNAGQERYKAQNSPTPSPQAVASAPKTVRPVKGLPDTRMALIFKHMRQSKWAANHVASDVDIDREIRDKLHADALTAYGRVGADGNCDPLRTDVWVSLKLNPKTGNAETPDGDPMYYDIQFEGVEVSRLWPALRDDW